MPTPDTARAGAQPAPAQSQAVEDILRVYEQPLNDLLQQAHAAHRRHFPPNEVQLSTLLNIKSGACPEDCAYCPQSARYPTGLAAEPLMDVAEVRAAAAAAAANGASRFCMGAAWRSPKERDIDALIPLIDAVHAEGLESCVTLGMLTPAQAERLAAAGLDYYNHNLDTSEAFYPRIISTRTYADRLATLENVRAAGIKVCCGGILGLGETRRDRCALLQTLAAMDPQPESVPVNMLVRVAGTPLADAEPVDTLELIRTIATARVLMPATMVRLSAGRSSLTEAEQALAFFAGANSIFYGEKLLTTDNPELAADRALFAKLGITASTTATDP